MIKKFPFIYFRLNLYFTLLAFFPKINNKDSIKFDFPLPLGPTIEVKFYIKLSFLYFKINLFHYFMKGPHNLFSLIRFKII